MYGILARSVHRAISHINVTNPHLTSAQTSIHSMIPLISVAHICKAVDILLLNLQFLQPLCKNTCGWFHSDYRKFVLCIITYGYNLIRKSRSLHIKSRDGHVRRNSAANNQARTEAGRRRDPASQTTPSATMPVPGEYQQVLGMKGGRG